MTYVIEQARAAYVATASRALAAGCKLNMRDAGYPVLRWDLATQRNHPCVEPQLIVKRGLVDEAMPAQNYDDILNRHSSDIAGEIHLATRCRRCAPCRRHRSVSWQAKAEFEVARSERTWFFTGTFHPAEITRMKRQAKSIDPVQWSKLKYGQRTRFLNECGKPSKHQKRLWAASTNDRRFERLRLVVNHRATGWLQNVRNNSEHAFRYLMVIEAHKSGEPHIHALIHEFPGQPVPHAALSDAWRSGSALGPIYEASLKWDIKNSSKYENFNRVAWYTCKYISKGPTGRVRSSIRYGQMFE